jgi:energy-coupling factor transporter transmembrane protein EcfT
MAELTIFSYRSGNSFVHQFDVRFKILILIIISMVSLNVRFLSLTILSFIFAILVIHCRIDFKSFFKEIRYFLILLFIILIARALSTKGPNVIEFYFITISRHGLYEGALICWRLLLILLVGLLFITTTRSSEIKSAVEWFLNPIPFVSSKKVATMLSLVMRFVPVILNQARETVEAQKARCVESRKNPIYRAKKIGIPLLRRTFENADRLVFAMEARCYNDKRTNPDLSAKPRDGLILLLVCIFCTFLLIL